MGQKSSQAERQPHRAPVANMGWTVSSQSAPSNDILAASPLQAASHTDEYHYVGVKRKRASQDVWGGENDHEAAGAPASSQSLPSEQTSKKKRQGKKRRRRDSSVSMLGVGLGTPASPQEFESQGLTARGFTAANETNHRVSRKERFDVNSMGQAEDYAEPAQHPLDDVPVERGAAAETYKTYGRASSVVQATKPRKTGPEVRVPQMQPREYLMPEKDVQKKVDDRFRSGQWAVRQGADPKDASEPPRKKHSRRITTSKDATLILAKKSKKRKSPTDSGYSTGSTSGRGLRQGQLLGVFVESTHTTPSGSKRSRNQVDSAQEPFEGHKARLTPAGNAPDDVRSYASEEGYQRSIPAAIKGKGKMVYNRAPPATLNTSPLGSRKRDSTMRSSGTPFDAAKLAARIRAEEDRENYMLGFRETSANQPKRASKDAASRKISNTAEFEAKVLRERRIAEEAKRKAARKSMPDRLGFLRYSPSLKESQINSNFAGTSASRRIIGTSEEVADDLRSQRKGDSEVECQQVLPAASTHESDLHEGGAGNESQAHESQPAPLPQPSRPLSISSAEQNVVSATPASSTHESLKRHENKSRNRAEMLERVAALQRGEQLRPPCDRCREHSIECVKYAASCLDCNKRHRKCTWDEVTEQELIENPFILPLEDEETVATASPVPNTDLGITEQGTKGRAFQEVMTPTPFERSSGSIKKTPNGQGNDSDSSDTEDEPVHAADLGTTYDVSSSLERDDESGPFENREHPHLPSDTTLPPRHHDDENTESHAETEDIDDDENHLMTEEQSQSSVGESDADSEGAAQLGAADMSHQSEEEVDPDSESDGSGDSESDDSDKSGTANQSHQPEEEEEEEESASESAHSQTEDGDSEDVSKSGAADQSRHLVEEEASDSESAHTDASESEDATESAAADQSHQAEKENDPDSESAHTEDSESEDVYRSPDSSADEQPTATPPRRVVRSAPNSATASPSPVAKASKDRRKSAPSQQASSLVRAQIPSTACAEIAKPHGSLTQPQLTKLQRFKNSYCIEHNLNERTFADKIQANANNNRELARFWDLVVSAVEWTGKRPTLQKAVRRIYHNYRRGGWTAAEDAELASLYAEMGPQWRRIADELERMPEDVRDRFRNHVKGRGTYVSNAWSYNEERALVRAVAECAALGVQEKQQEARAKGRRFRGYDPDFSALVIWGSVSERMGGTRSRAQCREKTKSLLESGRTQFQAVVDYGLKQLARGQRLAQPKTPTKAVKQKQDVEESGDETQEEWEVAKGRKTFETLQDDTSSSGPTEEDSSDDGDEE